MDWKSLKIISLVLGVFLSIQVELKIYLEHVESIQEMENKENMEKMMKIMRIIDGGFC